MSSVQSAIISFLRSKGLSDVAIAGILGNLQEESGFRTTALNGREGAIGLAQWEGGRRTALQAYARAHGSTETDLNMQLGYMWHELTTGYSGVLQQLKSVTSVSQAATIWDAHYEVSDGSTRQARISYATSFAQSGLKGGPMPAGVPSGGDSASVGGGAASAASAGTTIEDYESVNSLGNLLKSVPELNKLLQDAQAGDWSTAKFENAVENSAWWKTHSQTARALIVQKANDPASYQQSLNNVTNSIKSLAHQLGMGLTPDQLSAIANTAMLTGNDSNQAWLSQQIAYKENYKGLTSTKNLQGGMAATAQQLATMAADYGYKWTPAQLAQKAQAILGGMATIDTYKQNLITWAKSAFPGFSQQLDAGTSLKDLAAPYVQSMSSLLEVDPASLDLYNPTIRKALQGSAAKAGDTPTAQPLWQFENQLRKDPRWSFTDNAHASMATMALQLGQTWGFNG